MAEMYDDEPITCVTPIDPKNHTAVITLPWFPNGTEYTPLTGTVELLLSGEATFRSLYRALEGAKHSISIICWAFQPSMYLIRQGAMSLEELAQRRRSVKPPRKLADYDGKALPLGELLRAKAAEGVKVRILSWGFMLGPVNIMGFTGENNTPGYRMAIDNYNSTASSLKRARRRLRKTSMRRSCRASARA